MRTSAKNMYNQELTVATVLNNATILIDALHLEASGTVIKRTLAAWGY